MAITGQSIFGNAAANVGKAFANNLGVHAPGAGDGVQSLDYLPLSVIMGGSFVDDYTVERITRSLGGAHVDQVVITAERVRGTQQLHIQDGPLRPEEHGRQVSIFNGGTRIFWGVVEDANYSFGESADRKTIVASIQPWHFGPPVAAAQYLSISRPTKGKDVRSVTTASEPIVFNGFVDASREMKGQNNLGYFVGNCAHLGRYKAKKRDGKEVTYEANMLVPLEVLQTSAGQSRYVDDWRAFDTRSRWTLRNAARYLCALGNYETLIENPKDGDYDTLPDVTLPRTEMHLGMMLPQMLDDLLTPYGCGWYVDVGDDDEPNNKPITGASIFAGAAAAISATIKSALGAAKKPRIRFVRFQLGPECQAKYARVGAPASFSTTNICNAEMNYSTATTINEIHCIGEAFTVEGTFELFRVSDRKWVLNEAGDYPTSDYHPYHRSDERGLATEVVPVPDLKIIFPDGLLGSMASTPFVSRIQRRRRLLPTITVSDTITGDTQPKGPHNGYLIEVIDLGQEDKEEKEKDWISIDKIHDAMFRHIRVLEEECAIIFDPGVPEDDEDSATPPKNEFIEALGDNARMRITGTLVGDFAVQKIITREGRSPSVSATSRAYVWHDPKRWPCRRIITDTRYASQYQGDPSTMKTPTVDEVISDMEKAAKAILERTDAAQIGGSLTFFGLDHFVPLGGVVKVLAGRGVTMGTRYESDSATTASNSDNPQYPQIVAVEWSPQVGEVRAILNIEPGEGLEAIQ